MTCICVLCDQFFWLSLANDRSLIDDRNARTEFLSFVQVMRSVDNGGALCIDLLEVIDNRISRLYINPDRGLIKKEHFGLMKNSGNKIDTAFHPSGEGVDFFVRELRESQGFEMVLDAFFQFVLRNTVHTAEIHQVFSSGQGWV